MSSHLDFFYISAAFILLSLAAIAAIIINRRRKRAGKRVLRGGAPESRKDARESRKWERSEAWGVAIAVLTLVSSTAIGVAQLVNNEGASTSARNDSGPVNYVDQSIPVEGRAASPSDIWAPGVMITNPRGDIEFQNLAGISETLTFRDLNTIVATSKVPVDVNLDINPNITTLTATSIRRLQYVADLMGMQDDKLDLGIIAYTRYDSGNKVGAAVLIVNGHPNAVNITSLHVTVWNVSRSKKFLDEYFFSEEQPLSVAAKTSLFGVLTFDEKTLASFPSATHFTSYSFY